MEISVAAQAGEIGRCALTGLALGVVYDLLRGLRRLQPRLTGLADLVFDGVFWWAMLWLMLVPGQGRLRLYDLIAVFLGLLLWFLTVGPFFLRLWVRILRTAGRFLSFLFRPLTKILKALISG